MLKKTITYKDFNGDEHTDDFYFHLSKAEAIELEASYPEGLHEKIQNAVSTKNMKDIVALFKMLILKSYGVKSEDGKRFVKSDELSKEFEQTDAYSELFLDLATNEGASKEFVDGVIPDLPAEA